MLLVLGEVLDMVCQMVACKKLKPSWRACQELVDVLTLWEEDKRSAGLLGAIGLGPASSVSTR